MRTVGMLLKEERLRLGFTLEQVEKATKIRVKFLKALENDEFKKMPALPYVQGFLKNYSTFLGLKSVIVLAMFRRQFIHSEKQKVENIEESLTNTQWQITPNKVVMTAVIFSVAVLFAYFYAQYQALHAPPPLSLEQPKTDTITKETAFSVFGNTDTDATITINNEPVLVKEGGRFYKDVALTVGENTLMVEATSRIGEKTTLTRRITRSP